jgi:hypothetical protein
MTPERVDGALATAVIVALAIAAWLLVLGEWAALLEVLGYLALVSGVLWLYLKGEV